MMRRFLPAVVALMFCIVMPFAVCDEEQKTDERLIPVIVKVGIDGGTAKFNEPIPMTITISNGLKGSISHNTFSIEANEWNGETINVILSDIYRDGRKFNLYFARPDISPPSTVSGMARYEIKPGKDIVIKTDARKWIISGGWIPGKYSMKVGISNITVDGYSKITVFSDPVEFEIK